MPVQNRDIFMETTGDPLLLAPSILKKKNIFANYI